MRRVREGRTRPRSVSSAWSLITCSDGSPARLKLGAAAQARQSERERTNSTGNAPFVGGLGVPRIDGAVTSTTSSTRSSAMHGSSTSSTLATISSLVVWPGTRTPRLESDASINWRRVQVVVIDLRTQLYGDGRDRVSSARRSLYRTRRPGGLPALDALLDHPRAEILPTSESQ